MSKILIGVLCLFSLLPLACLTMSMQSVRGTHDLLPEDCAKHLKIIEISRERAARFGFHEMSTPIFEFSKVFKKTLGDASDIVSKEMYTFKDRNDEELTLRPEGTAGVARAFISEGLSQRVPLKLFYQGPMFRYERPQKGRQRQFTQIGVELIGAASPWADVECIALAQQILHGLNIHASTRLEINSIGDKAARAAYRDKLVNYLSPFKDKLSEDSQRRLTLNPLRILDSKDPRDQEFLKNAPQVAESYNDSSKQFFETVLEGLTALGVSFEVNPRLVSGLDYYTHCVFEFKSGDLGAQDAILSGGRYDDLIGQMGGPDTPGVGWAAGVERLALLSPVTLTWPKPLAVIPVHDSVEKDAYRIANELREQGFVVEMSYSGNLSKRMKKASGNGAFAAVLVGPEELAKGFVGLKNLGTGEQVQLPHGELSATLKKISLS